LWILLVLIVLDATSKGGFSWTGALSMRNCGMAGPLLGKKRQKKSEYQQEVEDGWKAVLVEGERKSERARL
jgi:hypothetical protein